MYRLGTRQHIEAILRGQLMLAACDPPRVSLGDLVQIARRAYDAAQVKWDGDPRELMWGLDITPVVGPTAGCGELTNNENWIGFRWSPNRRERGLRLFHGIAHILLNREQWEHSEADVHVLTAELAAPRWALRRHGLDEVAEVAALPIWLIEAWASTLATPETTEQLTMEGEAESGTVVSDLPDAAGPYRKARATR